MHIQIRIAIYRVYVCTSCMPEIQRFPPTSLHITLPSLIFIRGLCRLIRNKGVEQVEHLLRDVCTGREKLHTGFKYTFSNYPTIYMQKRISVTACCVYKSVIATNLDRWAVKLVSLPHIKILIYFSFEESLKKMKDGCDYSSRVTSYTKKELWFREDLIICCSAIKIRVELRVLECKTKA